MKATFKKGDRVRAIAADKASEFVESHNTPGWPGRWEYFEIEPGSEGTIMRSSCASGPTYKVILWDFNDREGEVHKGNLALIDS